MNIAGEFKLISYLEKVIQEEFIYTKKKDYLNYN